jgi:predicted dehydrogenase
LIGLGNDWETRHRPALRALSDRLEVRAICEPVAHRAKLAAAEFGARKVDGFRALAALPDVDAVVLLSAGWFGPMPILAACDAGKAVYCASTLELEPQLAARIRARVEASGVAFVAEFPCRQSPATLRLKELIATHLGPARLLFCHQRKSAPKPKEPHQATTMRELIEVVDWCRYVVGSEPTSVVGSRHWTTADRQETDYEMMSLDFSTPGQLGTGAVAQISCGRYMPPTWHEAISFRPPAALQVTCERGVAFVDLPATITWFDNAGRHMESLESERPVGEQLLQSFYRSVTSLVRDTSSLDDAFRAQSIVLQAEKSFEQGQRMPLDS